MRGMMVYSLGISLSRLVQRALSLAVALEAWDFNRSSWPWSRHGARRQPYLACRRRDVAWGLAVFTALGLLPPLPLLVLWNDPSQTLSENIQQGR